MTPTNGLLNTIAFVVGVGAILALVAGVPQPLPLIVAHISLAFALLVYWRQRPPGWPRGSR